MYFTIKQLYILYNDDPNYLSVFVTTLNTITINNIPRIFIIDSDRDGYPDILANDKGQNTIGLYFNKGKEYWNEIKKNFRENNFNKDLVYKKISWNFIPLIDIYEENLNGKIIRDFTVLKVESNSRVNFEVFILYDDQLVWFIEKKIDMKLLTGKKIEQNYSYCMSRCNIVLDHQSENIIYNMIMDIDINNDMYPEFIVYSESNNSLQIIQHVL